MGDQGSAEASSDGSGDVGGVVIGTYYSLIKKVEQGFVWCNLGGDPRGKTGQRLTNPAAKTGGNA